MHFDPSAFVADSELFHALRERAAQLNYPDDANGEVMLFQQGDPPIGIYLIEKGSATICLHGDDGEQFILFEAGDGTLLGLLGLLGDYPYAMTAIAHAGAMVSFVSPTDFHSLMEANPKLSLKMLRMLAAEVRTARQALD